MKLFLRVNRTMARSLVDRIVKVTQPAQVEGMKTHHCVWTLTYDATLVSFLRCQDPESFQVSPCGKFANVGVSLSAMTMDVAAILAERPDITRVVTHTRHQQVHMIQNDKFGYSPWIGWCPLVAPVSSISPAEQQFRDLAGKTDLYYQYSDSIAVWRAGEARHKALMEEGKALGLSRDQMDRIIRSLMAR